MTYVPILPFDISCISSAKSKRYILYDVELITWLRRKHHILGVLVGSIPQAPSQNVFLGLPLELMPEEVRLLVEKGLARVVDDSAWFSKVARHGVVDSKSRAYRNEIIRNGTEAAESARKAAQVKAIEGAKKMKLNQQKAMTKNHSSTSRPEVDLEADDLFNDSRTPTAAERDIPLSQPLAVTKMSAGVLAQDGLLHGVTPAENASYLLFRTLHEQGYFMSPGIRFGCQFTAYPGDPLRYHSHHLAVAVDSNKRIPLIDIVGGGRLATAVKKSFLLGAVKTADSTHDLPCVRIYVIEWAAI